MNRFFIFMYMQQVILGVILASQEALNKKKIVCHIPNLDSVGSSDSVLCRRKKADMIRKPHKLALWNRVIMCRFCATLGFVDFQFCFEFAFKRSQKSVLWPKLSRTVLCWKCHKIRIYWLISLNDLEG